MWETKILGVDLYHVLAWFWLYSFCGWIWESSYVSIRQKKLVNRGFVNGPLLTLYGTGAVMVYLILRPFEANVWALYFGGVIVATVLEYVTGVLMETIFHAHWWDYSNQKFNFQGKICLSSSIAWGFFTLGLFYILQPIAVKVVNLVSDTTGEIIVSVVTVCYLVDFGFSAAAAFQLGQKMRSLEKTWGEFLKYLQKSRFNQLAEEMNAKVQQYRAEYSRDKMKEYLAEKRQTLSEAMEQMQKLEKERKEAEGRRNPLSESKNRLMEFGAEQKERLAEFGAEQKERFAALGFDVRSDKMPDLKELLERFDQMTKPQLPTNWLMRLTTKRYLRAYPHLQGTHHASLKKEEKKAEEKEEKNKGLLGKDSPGKTAVHAKTCTAVLFSGFAIVFEKELKLGTEILFQEIFLRKKGVGPLKIVRAAFEILAEGRGEKLFLLRKKCTGPPLIAVGSLCFLTVFRIDKRANALVNSLILQRKIIVILIVREEIFQLRRMRLQGERNP